jgi:hypothetical protein
MRKLAILIVAIVLLIVAIVLGVHFLPKGEVDAKLEQERIEREALQPSDKVRPIWMGRRVIRRGSGKARPYVSCLRRNEQSARSRGTARAAQGYL